MLTSCLSQEGIIEEYPILYVKENMVPFLRMTLLKEYMRQRKILLLNVSQAAGKWIYERNIPEISDFCGRGSQGSEKKEHQVM
jgi:hypothetical protein